MPKHTLNVAVKFLWGVKSNITFDMTARHTVKPERVFSNAPRDGGAFLFQYKRPSGTVEEYDLSIASSHILPIDWPIIQAGKSVAVTVVYSGYVPRGYVWSQGFTLTLTIEGNRVTDGPPRFGE